MSDGGGSQEHGDRYDFFVDYAPPDRAWAQWITWQIENHVSFADGHGARVLVQEWDAVPGGRWTAAKDRALRGRVRVVPVVSRAFLEGTRDGDWQTKLAHDPDGFERMVVPIRVDDCSPRGLLSLRTFIDLAGLDETNAGEALVAGVNAAVQGSFRPTAAPAFPGAAKVKPAFPGGPPDVKGAASPVTVLHLTGLRFGSEQRNGERLLDELQGFGVAGALRPDLVVVTGDLTESSEIGEFDQAHSFLASLADGIGLNRTRFALVPGSRDVNRMLCALYVQGELARRRTPVQPFWPKWEFYDALLRKFYGPDAAVGFEVGEEWSTFEITDRRVVVLGLNSTMSETHEIRRGELGQRQLVAAAERLRSYEQDGWLRIGAVHHDPRVRDPRVRDPRVRDPSAAAGFLHDAADLDRILGPHLNLLLHGQRHDDGPARLTSGLPALAPSTGGFQVVRLDDNGWRLHASTGHVSDIYRRFPPVDTTFPVLAPSQPAEHEFDHHVQPRPPDALDDLMVIARLRFPKDTVTRVAQLEDTPAHLRVQGTKGQVVEMRVVGFIGGDADAASVDEFDRALRRPYMAKYPNLYALLVYGGEHQAAPEVARLAVQRGVELQSLAEYQGVLDLRGYRSRQRRALAADPDYPPELYVPQRIRRMDRSTRTGYDDALEQVTDWLTTDEARFVLVLGSFGHGKTFMMHKLALDLNENLPHVTPMLIKLRDLEKSLDLDRLVAQHLVDQGERRPDLNAFDYMRRQGRLVLLFDGFDELVARVTYERAVAHLDTLLGAVDGRAKVVVTSRREFFLTDDEVLKRTGEKVERTLGQFIVHIDDFTPEQVKLFLYRYYLAQLVPELPALEARRVEATRRADARLSLLRNLANLLDLASNPRLLSFIAALDDDRLVAARRQPTAAAAAVSGGSGAVTPADLYHELIEQWLDHETRRSPDLTSAERRAAITELAVTMWRAGEGYVNVAGLTAVAQRVLKTMHDSRGFTAAETAHELGTGTALRRDADGRFAFIHQSVMEYLVASKAASSTSTSTSTSAAAAAAAAANSATSSGPVRSGESHARDHVSGHTGILGSRRMSELMVDFFADLCGEQRAAEWAQAVLDDDEASPDAKANALLVATRRGFALRTGAKLAGANLAGQDLSSRRDLRGADLRGANLTDARVVAADLTDANLSDATMTGMTIRDTNLTDAVLFRANLRSVVISNTNLGGANLTGADLSGARLTDVNLTGAVVTGSRWARATVLGGQPATGRGGEALGAASVLGRDPAEAIVRAASSPADAVAFSPDCALLATGSYDGAVRLWDVATGRELRALTGHTKSVTSVAFSPDCSLLATGSDDGTARRWDVTTGLELRTVQRHTSRVWSVAFNSDGTLLATGPYDSAAQLWDATTGQELRTFQRHTSRVWSVALSSDGALLATGSYDGTARLWNATTGEELCTLTGHTDTVTSVALSSNGMLLATASDDGTARLWDLSTGKGLRTLQRHTSKVRSVALSSDGALLATGSYDGTVRIWELTAGRELRSLTGHTNTVSSVAFSADGNLIASVSADGTTRLWDATTSQELRTLQRHSDSARSVAFSPDGARLAAATDLRAPTLWDVATGKKLQSAERHTSTVRSVVFSPDGALLAAGHNDGTVRLWDRYGQELRALSGHTKAVTSVMFSPNGALVAAGHDDGAALLWDLAAEQEHPAFQRQRLEARSVAFSPDGNLLATASHDGTARLWELSTGRELGTLQRHTRKVWSVAFSPDGSLLATGSHDGTARLWDFRTGHQLRTLTGDANTVTSVTFSPDGNLLVTGTDDGAARLWDLTTGEGLRTLRRPTLKLRSVAFSPDGTMLATGSDDGTARLWEVATGDEIAIMIGTHDGWAVLLPDGRYKLVGDPAGTFWWMVKTIRFEPGELDAYDRAVRRLPDDARLPLPAAWRLVTPRRSPPAGT